MRKKNGSEKLDFIEAMKQNIKQREEVDFAGEEFSKIWLEDQRVLNKKNKITLRTYVEAGLYFEQLKTYEQYFPVSQIHVLFMDDLRRDLSSTMKSIFSFLIVSDDCELTSTDIKNPYSKNRLKILNNLFGKETLSKIAQSVSPAIKNKIVAFARVNEEKPKMTAEEYQFVYNIFEDDIESLAKYLNRNLDHWKL